MTEPRDSSSDRPDRVLEIGGIAAAYCGRLFVRAGADVVRADLPQRWPAWASDEAMNLFLHAGKRRVAASDPPLIARLAAQADVVICEARGAAELGELGFDDWQAPVKVALTPFGMTGPKRDWHGAPSVILAMGGYTNLIGDPDKAPLSLPGHYVEFQTGTLAYAAANACRLAKTGNTIDISMLETVMSLSQFTTVRWHCAGEHRTRHGNDFWFVVPSELFRCADGWVYVNIVPGFWDAFTVFIERPDLLLDPRFENNDLRMANRAPLHEMIAAALIDVPKAELLERARVCRIPLGAVLTFDEVLADAHLAARDYWEQLQTQGDVSVRVPGLPYRLSGESRPRLAPATVLAGDTAW